MKGRRLNDRERLVFLRRQSPPWDQLAADFRATGHVEPARYVPRDAIPHFPANLERLVGRWNQLFELDFFSCRAKLKSIAEQTLQAVPDSACIDYDEHRSSLPASARFVLFVDDDDWFSPHIGTLSLPVDAHVILFPLVRLMPMTTFVPSGESARTLIGQRRDFDFSLQTSNYAINLGLWRNADLSLMKDHVLASRYFDASRMSSRYIDRIVSVTNKTPASAARLRFVEEEETFLRYARDYVRHVEDIDWPDELHWARAPAAESVELFRTVLASRC